VTHIIGRNYQAATSQQGDCRKYYCALNNRAFKQEKNHTYRQEHPILAKVTVRGSRLRPVLSTAVVTSV